VAQLLTGVLATFELASANLETDMFGFKVVVGISLLSLSFGSLLLSRAAMLTAFMATAVELNLANAEAHWGFDLSLMADAV
jgi:hypothetical protein